MTCEEVGIDSNLPFEEKVRRYNEQIENGEAGIGTEVLEIEDDLGELSFEEEYGAF